MRHVTTENSVYEINEAEHMVRRMHGRNEATPRQGTDGEWQAYDSLTVTPCGLLILWDYVDGVAQCTVTSDVILDDGEAWGET